MQFTNQLIIFHTFLYELYKNKHIMGSWHNPSPNLLHNTLSVYTKHKLKLPGNITWSSIWTCETIKSTILWGVPYYPCCGSPSQLLPYIHLSTCLQLHLLCNPTCTSHLLFGNIWIWRPVMDVKSQRINLENVCLPNKLQCGHILSTFEIVRFKKY
jgi:hypothetical protein